MTVTDGQRWSGESEKCVFGWPAANPEDSAFILVPPGTAEFVPARRQAGSGQTLEILGAASSADFNSMEHLMKRGPVIVPPRPDAADDLPSRLEKRQKALKVPELAEAIGLGRTAMYEHVRAGSIAYLRIGGAIRIDPVVAAQWLRDHTVEPPGHEPTERRSAA